MAKSSNKECCYVTSQSDSDLVTKKRNPFADSDDEDDDDFVDISKLPPLPAKSQSKPRLFPKQKINKSRSDLEKINQEILIKLRRNVVAQDDDYEEVPTVEVDEGEAGGGEDYDEPIPLH